MIKPKIRFEDFKSPWNTLKLGEVLLNRKSKGVKGAPLYSVTIKDGLVPRSELRRNIISDSVDTDNLLAEKNDIVYNMMRMWQGAFGLANEKCLVSPAYVVLAPSKEVSPRYLNYHFKRSRATYLFKSYSYGLTLDRLRLYYKDFARIKLNLPSLPEQQQIASFLSAVDKIIQLLERKKELLEQYKKGVMQQIFSQEIRFKDEDGIDFPEWEEKRLGEVATNFSTNSLSRVKLNYNNGEVYNIHYGDIHTSFKTHFDIEFEKTPLINTDVNLDKIKQDSYCEIGDLVVADASEDYEDIGKSIEITNTKNRKVLAGLHTILVRPQRNIFSLGFLSLLMQVWKVRKQIMIYAQGTKVLGLSAGRLLDVKIPIPDIREQKKITSMLTALESNIVGLSTKIEKYKEFKKGLLQQMFV